MDITAQPVTAPRVSIRRILLVTLTARTVLDTATRAVDPFLTFIALGLGVPYVQAAQIVQVRNLVGLTAPLFGPLSDRYGRRAMMLVGMAGVAFSSLALWFAPSLGWVIVVMTLGGLGTIIYIPAQQAYYGDQVPYAQRGRAMALAELSWAAAAIIGLPLVGFVLEKAGWRSGFALIGVLAVGAIVLLWFGLPEGERTHLAHVGQAATESVWLLLRQPVVIGALVVSFLLAAGNENLNVSYGAWMNSSFGLNAATLGFVAAAIGGAELVSELFAAGFVDRIGKWRVVAASLLLGSLAYFLLPLLSGTALMGALGLVLTYFMFELGVVASLPFYTEIAPAARGVILSASVAAFSLGRAAGSFSGPTLFTQYGFGAVSLVSGVGVMIAFLIWVFVVRERHPA